MPSSPRQKVIQANSPKLLAEEVARFSEAGWRATGEPVALISAELGRPTYWAQTLGFTAEVTASVLSPERSDGDGGTSPPHRTSEKPARTVSVRLL